MAAGRARTAPLALLRANALRKGLLRGSGPWTFVAVLLWLPKVLRWLFGRRPEHLGTVKVAPGESIRIDTVRTVSSRDARRRRREGRGARPGTLER